MVVVYRTSSRVQDRKVNSSRYLPGNLIFLTFVFMNIARKGRPSSMSEFSSPAKARHCQRKHERGTLEFLSITKPVLRGTMWHTLDCAFLLAALTFATSCCRNYMFRKERTQISTLRRLLRGYHHSMDRPYMMVHKPWHNTFFPRTRT